MIASVQCRVSSVQCPWRDGVPVSVGGEGGRVFGAEQAGGNGRAGPTCGNAVDMRVSIRSSSGGRAGG